MTRNGASRAWHTARPAFRRWRKDRPFWGGLLILLAGIIIVAAPALNPLPLIVQQGIAGISGYLAGVLLMAVGVLVWLQPPQRFFYGIAAILLSLVSFITSNFGGFVFGMLFGLNAGALALAWVPDRKRKAPRPRRGPAGGAESGAAATGPDGEEAAARPGSARESGDPAQDTDPETGQESGPAIIGGGDDSRGTAPESADDSGGTSGGVSPTAPGQHRRSSGGSGTPADPSAPPPADPSAPPKTGGAAWQVDEPWSDAAGGRGTGGGDRLHSLAALAAALVIAVPAPAAVSWPWDDWFGGGEETPAPDPTQSPTPTPSPSSSSGTGDGSDEEGDSGDGGQQDDSGDGGDGDGGGQKDAPAAEKCAVQPGPATMSEQEYRSLLQACRQAKEDGKQPEFDVQESDDRWLAHTEPSGLTADKLSMEGAAFEGVVEYPVEGGTVRYLKLSMDKAELTGARQWAEHNGATTSLEIPEMTMSGDVVMHVTRMKVRILGIPLEFTPSFPPPLLLPSMTVTDLDADQPLAQAQTVEITGLDERVKP